MSSSNDAKNSNGTNGSITLKSFAELANVLDLESLPPGPPDTDDETPSAVDSATTQREAPVIDEPTPIPSTQLDLASLIAQLANVSSGLETMARQDARAREQATVELAQYEALAAERREAERALADARRVRATAELLVTEAFTEQARADAARHAAVARAAELSCTQLLAERIRAADELASRPHLARVVAERRQREQEQAEAAERAETERAARLANGIAAARQARHEGRLDEARGLLVSLVWPPSTCTSYPRISLVASSVSGRTTARSSSVRLACTSLGGTRRPPAEAWSWPAALPTALSR